jgi:hypothetical protein
MTSSKKKWFPTLHNTNRKYGAIKTGKFYLAKNILHCHIISAQKSYMSRGCPHNTKLVLFMSGNITEF